MPFLNAGGVGFDGGFSPAFARSIAPAYVFFFSFRSSRSSNRATWFASVSDSRDSAASQVASAYPKPRHLTRYCRDASASSGASSSESEAGEAGVFSFPRFAFLAEPGVFAARSSCSSSGKASLTSMTRSTSR